MCAFGITRMWVGLRGAMSWKARTARRRRPSVDGSSPRTIRQNRQSGRGERSAGIGRRLRWAAAAATGRGSGPTTRSRASGSTASTATRPMTFSRSSDRPTASARRGDERVVRGVADPATVGEARLEQDLAPSRRPAPRPSAPGRRRPAPGARPRGASSSARRRGRASGSPRCRAAASSGRRAGRRGRATG